MALLFLSFGDGNVTKLIKSEMVEGMNCVPNKERNSVCEACIMGKKLILVPLKHLKSFIVMSVVLCLSVLLEAHSILSLSWMIIQDILMFISSSTTMKFWISSRSLLIWLQT